MKEEDTNLDDFIELGKNIKNWRQRHSYEGSFKDIEINFKRYAGFFVDFKGYKMKITSDNLNLASYDINRGNSYFNKMKKLEEYVLQNIKDQKKTKLNDALKEIRLDKEK